MVDHASTSTMASARWMKSVIHPTKTFTLYGAHSRLHKQAAQKDSA
jgi:hypothetical protein